MWKKPIVEIRVEEYTRGTLPKLLALHKELAMPILTKHIGRPLAFYMPSVGTINCLTQLWAYDSLAEFESRRAGVEAEPQWVEYMRASEGIIRNQNSRLTRRIVFPVVDNAPNNSHKKPVVDFRTYLIDFNKMPTFIGSSEAHALKVQLRHLGPPLGYYLTTVGNLNQITHIWGYESMGDMEVRRETRNADPEWQKYLDASDGIFERQDTQVLRRLNLFSDED